MSSLNRAFIGALGGLAAWLSKLLALDATQLSRLVEQELWLQAADLKVSIFVVLPVLVFLGAVIAWLTDESLRIKLFAIGVSAPAIIAPWTAKSVLPDMAALETVAFIQPAYAQSFDGGQRGSVVGGIKVLLGLTEIPDPKAQRYWVVVSSHADLDSAFQAAEAINRREPALQAFVGNRAPGNPLFPVIAGGPDGYLTLEDARKLQSFVDQRGIAAGGGFLSAFPDRFPASGIPR